MLLQLIDRGTVDLFADVSSYLPEFRQVKGLTARARPATILQLATMTAGLPTEPPDSGSRTGPASQWEAKLYAALPHVTYTHQPGTHFAYSNLGYAVLASALSRAAKITYVDWQRREILQPLGMRNTWFDYDASFAQRLARGYEVKGDGTLDTNVASRELRDGRGYKVPVGGVFTTVGDLAKFVSFELGHGPSSVLPRARLDSAFNGVVAASLEMDMGYGLGFMAQRRGNFPWLGHSGGVPGYTAMMYFERDHDIGVIVLRNATGGKAQIGRLAPDLLRLLIDEKIKDMLKREAQRGRPPGF
jgi:CubicO group peptidase (beta-lactamase class C family)